MEQLQHCCMFRAYMLGHLNPACLELILWILYWHFTGFLLVVLALQAKVNTWPFVHESDRLVLRWHKLLL